MKTIFLMILSSLTLASCYAFMEDGCCWCGDNSIDGEEECEEYIITKTCQSFGFFGGQLKCSDECKFDTSDCYYEEDVVCGDGQIMVGEICDSDNLDGNSCHSLNLEFEGGVLACNETCDGWDFSGCYDFHCYLNEEIEEFVHGDFCDDMTTQKYNPVDCFPDGAAGEERIFPISIEPGFEIIIEARAAYDFVLYLIENCENTSGTNCLAATDLNTEYPFTESMIFSNTGEETIQYILVIDIKNKKRCDFDGFYYRIDVNKQPIQ
ncbi:hypothetical protein KKF34_04790 [Myxococcota bacterium]|nr:hypothetical protein [Myxococcota bacterium]MBU1379474.1 hypothetical protein [Myxococcota bacterium]MBU1496177.1 hypothetical protein [Myxococcota bacterium]